MAPEREDPGGIEPPGSREEAQGGARSVQEAAGQMGTSVFPQWPGPGEDVPDQTSNWTDWLDAFQRVLLVKTPIWFCIDLSKLNNQTVKDAYSLPHINETLNSQQGSQWFSSLNLKPGYWQVEIDEESKPLTTSPWGHWDSMSVMECFQIDQSPCHLSAVDRDLPWGPQPQLVYHLLRWYSNLFKDLASHLKRMEVCSRNGNRLGWNLSPLNLSYSAGKLHTWGTLSLPKE